MTRTWRRVIAALEIIGGISGVGLLIMELAHVELRGLSVVLAGIVLLIYLLSFAAGVLLWRGHKWGRSTSIVVQAIQLPKLVSPILVFNICLGLDMYPYLNVGTDSVLGIGLEIKFLAFHNLAINLPIPGVGMGISIPATIFLARLISASSKQTPGGWFGVPPPTEPQYLPNDPQQARRAIHGITGDEENEERLESAERDSFATGADLGAPADPDGDGHPRNF